MTKKQDPKKLALELAQLKEEHSALEETAKRAVADLQNFKRRIEEERSELKIFANAQLLEALFPIIDNLKDLSITSLKTSQKTNGSQASNLSKNNSSTP